MSSLYRMDTFGTGRVLIKFALLILSPHFITGHCIAEILLARIFQRITFHPRRHYRRYDRSGQSESMRHAAFRSARSSYIWPTITSVFILLSPTPLQLVIPSVMMSTSKVRQPPSQRHPVGSRGDGGRIGKGRSARSKKFKYCSLPLSASFGLLFNLQQLRSPTHTLPKSPTPICVSPLLVWPVSSPPR